MPILIVSQNGQKAQLFHSLEGIECFAGILAVWIVINCYAGGGAYFNEVLKRVHPTDCYGSA